MDLIFYNGKFMSSQNQQRQSSHQKNTIGTMVAKTSIELSERRFQLPVLNHRAGERGPTEAASQRGASSLLSCLLINEQFHRVVDILIEL